MSLLAPLWLAGLAALALPIALHLLSRGRARRVRVGSVQLLAAAAARQPRRIALQRPLLLLARCATLAVVVLALAGPRQAGTTAPLAVRPWLLVEPGLGAPLPAAATGPGPRGEAPEARWLAPGLPLVAGGTAGIGAGAGARPGSPDSRQTEDLPDLATVPGGVWSLLREASLAAPAGSELRVVTRGRLAVLAGERPSLPRRVRWLEVPDERPNRWLERVSRSAAGDGAGGIVAVVATSDRASTTFAALPADDGEPRPEPASPQDEAGPPRLADGVARLPGGDALPGDDTLPLPPAPAPVRVALVAAPGRESDARYLAAAARAAAAEAGVQLELVTAVRPAASAAPPRLAFWLGDAPPPSELVAAAQAGATLVLDAARPEARCAGSVQPVAGGPVVALRRCAALAGVPAGAGERAVQARWTSDQGLPLLVEEPAGRGGILRFAGRFHPAWSDLVLSPAFPAWLASLIADEAGERAGSELPASDRRSDGGQGAPARAEGAGPRRPAPEPSRAPERALWAALPLLLLAERWLAGRRR